MAFVVQRCGREVNGGAEAHCLTAATHMAAHWDVEILTTCALDYMTWRNHYPPGEENLQGVKVRRFPVTQERDVLAFNRLSEAIVQRLREASLDEQENWMRAQGPHCEPLIEYINAHRDNYDVFIFFTYLYAQTYFGLQGVRDKSLLAALAHDEWPIHMTMWDNFFRLPIAVIFNSVEERAFLLRRFPDANLDGDVVGVGIDPPPVIDANRFRQKFGIHGPFMLYLGRIDEAKNSPQLLEYFLRLRQRMNANLHLVLVGRSQLHVPQHPAIHELGFLGDHDKWNGLAACSFLVNPSTIESLSMVLLEAWHVQRPVLVNAGAEVMVGQCRRARGGLWYANFDEFERISQLLLNGPLGPLLGSAGFRYVESHYRWPRIEAQYIFLAERIARRAA